MHRQPAPSPFLLALIVGSLTLTACGTADTEESSRTVATSEAPEASAPAVPAPQGPPDPERVARGEGLFTERGCVACHKIGEGRLVGPDLAGVHERREFGWFRSMVMNPDSMIKNDAVARQLYAEYATPMTYMNVSADEVVALWDYIRDQSATGP